MVGSFFSGQGAISTSTEAKSQYNTTITTTIEDPTESVEELGRKFENEVHESVVHEKELLNVGVWEYRGEGSCNIVLSYTGENSFYVKIF